MRHLCLGALKYSLHTLFRRGGSSDHRETGLMTCRGARTVAEFRVRACGMGFASYACAIYHVIYDHAVTACLSSHVVRPAFSFRGCGSPPVFMREQGIRARGQQVQTLVCYCGLNPNETNRHFVTRGQTGHDGMNRIAKSPKEVFRDQLREPGPAENHDIYFNDLLRSLWLVDVSQGWGGIG